MKHSTTGTKGTYLSFPLLFKSESADPKSIGDACCDFWCLLLFDEVFQLESSSKHNNPLLSYYFEEIRLTQLLSQIQSDH